MPDARVLSGELAALAAAICWAVAVGMFRGPIATFGARAVNLAKSVISATLLGLTLLVLHLLGSVQGKALFAADARTLGLVAVSGLLGLTLGDTALFAAVGRIGPSRALLLQTLAPVLTALFAFALFGDHLESMQMLGGAVILVGVAMVIRSSGRRTDFAPGHPAIRIDLAGWLLGALAATGQAAGIVLAKEGMAGMPIVPASLVRLVVASLGLTVLLGLSGRLRASVRPLVSKIGLTHVVPPSVIGTYVAFLLMMASVAWAPAAVAAVLLATVPVWSLMLEAITSRRRIAPAELAGTLIAVAGVAVVTLS